MVTLRIYLKKLTFRTRDISFDNITLAFDKITFFKCKNVDMI